jgi:hypothetical protein
MDEPILPYNVATGASRYVVTHKPPGRKKPVQVIVGFRGAQILAILAAGMVARWQMINGGCAYPALNAPSTISRLIRAGIVIGRYRVVGPDPAGTSARTWWNSYELKGKLVSMEPVVSKRMKRVKSVKVVTTDTNHSTHLRVVA